MKTALLLVSALALALPVQSANAPSSKLIKDLEGVYQHRVPSKIVVPGKPDEQYEAEDVVEILGHGENSAYLRASLTVNNGHRCSIAGIAGVENGRIVFRDPDPDLSAKLACVVTVSQQGDALLLTDRASPKGPSTCSALCGSRASLGEYSMPLSKKAKINVAKLKSSKEYQHAVKAYANATQ